jgi:hypothetical protein
VAIFNHTCCEVVTMYPEHAPSFARVVEDVEEE